MHSYTRNPVFLVLDQLILEDPSTEVQPIVSDPLNFLGPKVKFSRRFLLQQRPSLSPPTFSQIQSQDTTSHSSSQHSPTIQIQPIFKLSPAPRLHRSGRRRTLFTPQGRKIFFSKSKPKLKNSHSANKPAPPHGGSPGTTQVVNGECQPQDPSIHSLLGWGSRSRRLRRRYYRVWKKTSRKKHTIGRLG